jgi:hypothetical protein
MHARSWYIGNSGEKLERALAILGMVQVEAGDDWELVLRPYRKPRTLEQNRRYWAILHEISAQPVEGKRFAAESYHEYFKAKFIGKEEVLLPNGEVFNRPISTTTLDTSQFDEYRLEIEAWAADHGIQLSDPRERHAA